MKARLIKVGQSRGFVPMWLFATIGCRAPLLILSTAQLTQLLAHRFNQKKSGYVHTLPDSTQNGYSILKMQVIHFLFICHLDYSETKKV